MNKNNNIISYIKKDKWLIIFVIILSIMGSTFSIFAPRLLGLATTSLTENVLGIKKDNTNYILQMIFLSLFLYIIGFILKIIYTQIMNKISQNLICNIRNDVQAKINRIPYGYFESRNDGETISKIVNDVDVIAVGFNLSVTQFASSSVTIIGVVIMMFYINYIMALIVISILPIIFVALCFIMKNTKKSFDKQQKELANVNSNLEEYYSGVEVIKSFGIEEKVIEKFEKINKKYYKATKDSNFLTLIVNPISIAIIYVGYILVIFAGSFLAYNGIIKIGDILTFSNYVNNITNPVQQLGNTLSSFQQMQVSSKRVFDFLNEEEEENKDNYLVENKNCKNDINFDNISFGYSKNNYIINNFNINVKKGSKVAIVGSTGAGKTTIIKLLLRLYDVNEGKILFDGVDIKNINRQNLRKNYSMVLQESWLFNGTIAENIKFGNENATIDDIKKVAKLSNADKCIDILPNGYDFLVDEDANNLSQGQKQMITIARAFLSNKDILILDEATSSIDTRTEVYVKKAMDELMKNKTIFVIAHRLKTIQNADIILVLKNGNIVEQGNHIELLNKKGYYYELYNMQFA